MKTFTSICEMNWWWASTWLGSWNEGAVDRGCWALSHSCRRQGRPGKLLRTHFTSKTYKQRRSNKRSTSKVQITTILMPELSTYLRSQSNNYITALNHCRVHCGKSNSEYEKHIWNTTMQWKKVSLQKERKSDCLHWVYTSSNCTLLIHT